MRRERWASEKGECAGDPFEKSTIKQLTSLIGTYCTMRLKPHVCTVFLDSVVSLTHGTESCKGIRLWKIEEKEDEGMKEMETTVQREIPHECSPISKQRCLYKITGVQHGSRLSIPQYYLHSHLDGSPPAVAMGKPWSVLL